MSSSKLWPQWSLDLHNFTSQRQLTTSNKDMEREAKEGFWNNSSALALDTDLVEREERGKKKG